jgi:quercetin dioxygenase-like cupin family protein
MEFLRPGAVFAAWIATAAVCLAAIPSDISARVELKRADLSGAPGMEVISSITEFKTGDELAVHSHHGIETGYVLQGSLVQYPGKAPAMLETGTAIMNLRDVPHGGFKVVGDRPLKLFTVHIVDKDKPLYEWLK